MQGEAGRLGDHQVTGVEDGLAQQFQDVLRAVAEHDAVGGHVQALSDGLGQPLAHRIGVAGDTAGHGLPYGFGDGRGHAERALVVGEFDDATRTAEGGHLVRVRAGIVAGQARHLPAYEGGRGGWCEDGVHDDSGSVTGAPDVSRWSRSTRRRNTTSRMAAVAARPMVWPVQTPSTPQSAVTPSR